MKKRLFFGFAFFVFLFMMVAWQFAAKELADLQMETKTQHVQNGNSEVV